MSDYWIYTSERRDPIALSGVTDVRRVKVRLPRGTYRDTGWEVGTAEILSTGTATTQSATVPVVVPVGVTVPNTGYTGLAGVITDEQAHIAPRVKYDVVSGYAFATGAAALPAAATANSSSVLGRALVETRTISSINTTTNRLTSAAHGFVNGDKVAVGGTTNPAPTTVTDFYGILRLSENTFSLLNWITGAVIDLTSSGSSVEVSLVAAAPRILPVRKQVTPDLTNEILDDTAALAGSIPVDNFITGDQVTVTGTLPTGLVKNTVYQLVALSGSSYQLYNSSGTLITLSGSSADFYMVMHAPAEPVDDFEIVSLDGLSGVLFYSDEIVSLVSNVDPNA